MMTAQYYFLAQIRPNSSFHMTYEHGARSTTHTVIWAGLACRRGQASRRRCPSHDRVRAAAAPGPPPPHPLAPHLRIRWLRDLRCRGDLRTITFLAWPAEPARRRGLSPADLRRGAPAPRRHGRALPRLRPVLHLLRGGFTRGAVKKPRGVRRRLRPVLHLLRGARRRLRRAALLQARASVRNLAYQVGCWWAFTICSEEVASFISHWMGNGGHLMDGKSQLTYLQ